MSYEDKKRRFYKELHRLWSMHLDKKNYKVSRRDLMKGMIGLGLSAGAAKYLMQGAPLGVRRAWAQEGDTPESRAIAAAKALFANSPKKTISIMHPSGSGGNMAPFTAEWKELTGFDVELLEVPVTQTHQKAMQEAVAKTEEKAVAYKYDAGLKGFATRDARIVWRDVARAPQQYEFGGVPNKDRVAMRARNRLAIIETGGGSLAVFPPPHKFFFAREIELNLGYVWYRKDTEESFSAGVRQADVQLLLVMLGR